MGKDNQIVNEASTQSVFKHSEKGENRKNSNSQLLPPLSESWVNLEVIAPLPSDFLDVLESD